MTVGAGLATLWRVAVIAFLGGWPVHRCRVAEKIGYNRVLVPSAAGVGSASRLRPGSCVRVRGGAPAGNAWMAVVMGCGQS